MLFVSDEQWPGLYEHYKDIKCFWIMSLWNSKQPKLATLVTRFKVTMEPIEVVVNKVTWGHGYLWEQSPGWWSGELVRESSFAFPCFNHRTNISPVVKVASKTVNNWSRYLGVCVVKSKHKVATSCFNCLKKMCPIVKVSRYLGVCGAPFRAVSSPPPTPSLGNPRSMYKSNTCISPMSCWLILNLP